MNEETQTPFEPKLERDMQVFLTHLMAVGVAYTKKQGVTPDQDGFVLRAHENALTIAAQYGVLWRKTQQGQGQTGLSNNDWQELRDLLVKIDTNLQLPQALGPL